MGHGIRLANQYRQCFYLALFVILLKYTVAKSKVQDFLPWTSYSSVCKTNFAAVVTSTPSKMLKNNEEGNLLKIKQIGKTIKPMSKKTSKTRKVEERMSMKMVAQRVFSVLEIFYDRHGKLRHSTYSICFSWHMKIVLLVIKGKFTYAINALQCDSVHLFFFQYLRSLSL